MKTKYFSRKLYIGWRDDIVISVEKINRTPEDFNLSTKESDEKWISIFDVYEIGGTKIEKFIGNPPKPDCGERTSIEDVLLKIENWLTEEEMEVLEESIQNKNS